MKRPTPAERAIAADAAYERGWRDSLDAHCRTVGETDVYWYSAGWQACAKYRWADPSNRGVAPDREYRKARI